MGETLVTRSPAYGLALWNRRICSEEEDADRRFREMAARWREHHYTVIRADTAWSKVIHREEVLREVVKRQEPGRLSVTYDRLSSPALDNYYHMVRQDQRLGCTFPQ